MSSLQEVLEKSSSLLKREKLHIKPLERVLFESNSLLSKLSGEEEGQGQILGNVDDSYGDDVEFGSRAEEEEEEDVGGDGRKRGRGKMFDEGADEFRLGETLLVEQGFNLGNYVNSLRDLSLSNLRELRAPIGDLPLSQFLFKEESFLLLSSVEESKMITSRSFEDGVRRELEREWKTFCEGISGGGGYILGGLDDGRPGPSQRPLMGRYDLGWPDGGGSRKEEEKVVEFLSGVVLKNVGKEFGGVLFSDYLEGYERLGKIEVYRFLEDLAVGRSEVSSESLVEYLERNYERHVCHRVDFFYGGGSNVGGVELATKYVKTLKGEEVTKWRVLFMLLRMNRVDKEFVRKQFEEEEDVRRYFLGTGEARCGRPVRGEGRDYYEKVVRNGIIGKHKKSVVFSKLKIEDYIWLQLKYFERSMSEMKGVLLKDKSEGYYHDNHFLFFRLNLFFSNYDLGLEYYYEHFPGDRVHFFHFFLLLYLKGKLGEKNNAKFVKTFDYYLTHFLSVKDQLIYAVFIRKERKVVQFYLNETFKGQQASIDPEKETGLLKFISRLYRAAKREEEEKRVIKKLEKNLAQNGFHLHAIMINAVRRESVKEVQQKDLLANLILKRVNFFILNNKEEKWKRDQVAFILNISQKLWRTEKSKNQILLENYRTESKLLAKNIILVNALVLLIAEKESQSLVRNLRVIPTQENEIQEKLMLWKSLEKDLKSWLKNVILKNSRFVIIYNNFFEKNILKIFLKKI